LRIASIAASCLLLATGATAAPKAPPKSLPYAGKMTHDRGDAWNYARPGLDLKRYSKLIIANTSAYRGPEAEFDGLDASDLQRFGKISDEALASELGKIFQITSAPGPNTLKLKLTLLGVEKTRRGLATYSRATPMGLAMSAVKSVAGKEGSFTGSVFYAIELTDSRSGELLVAATRRLAPDALDIPATLSTTETVKSVAKTSAKRIRERLEVLTGR
jgi:hypothetical protein